MIKRVISEFDWLECEGEGDSSIFLRDDWTLSMNIDLQSTSFSLIFEYCGTKQANLEDLQFTLSVPFNVPTFPNNIRYILKRANVKIENWERNHKRG